jgi:hypothetical protein
VLNGTEKQFGVVYDETDGTVWITTGEPYIPFRDELQGLKEPFAAIVSPHFFMLDGRPLTGMDAYLIEWYNYLRLRDLATLFDVAIEQGHARHAIEIERTVPLAE